MAVLKILSVIELGILREMIDEFNNQRQNTLIPEQLESDGQSRDIYAGTLDADCDKGTFCTVSIYRGQPGSETDAGWNLTDVYNGFADLKADALVIAVRTKEGQKYLASGECGTIGTG